MVVLHGFSCIRMYWEHVAQLVAHWTQDLKVWNSIPIAGHE